MNHPGGGQIVDLGSRSPARSDTATSSSSNNATSVTGASTTTTTTTLTTRYRRNGKLQSCEPCRKSKLRCDHSLPTCGRCIRRRCADKCVYHPAPMTQTQTQTQNAARSRSPSSLVPVQTPLRHNSVDYGGRVTLTSSSAHSRRASDSISSIAHPSTTASAGAGTCSGNGFGSGWTRQEQIQSPLPKDPFNTINSNVISRAHPFTYSPPSFSSPATSSSTSIPPLHSRLRPGSTPHHHSQQQHQTSQNGVTDNGRELSSPVNQDYMGATSFASVFSESLPRYGLSAELQCLRQYSHHPDLGKAFGSPSDDAVMIEQYSRVLALFQERSIIESLIERLLDVCNGSVDIFATPIIRGWLDGLWSVHGETLASQDPTAIQELSVLLWRNTSTQLTYNANTTPEEWVQASTGHNIRWEVLGIILAAAGDCCSALTSIDPIFADAKMDRVVVMRRASRGAKLCFLFCQDMSAAMDDLVLFLTRQLYSISVGTSTPGSFTAYQAAGCMIDAVVAMGLHGPDDADSAQRVPFFLSELRKRAFASSYAQEVGLATFLGRPPRLSYRHCRFTPATGLTNADILLPAEEREKLLTQLDPHGFRLDGVMNEQAFRKIWWTLSPRREDILDLSLCQYSPDEVLRRASEIEMQMEELWAILPESMRRARDTPEGYDKISPFERLLHDLCRHAFRANTLLLQRVVFQQVPGKSCDSLVRNAYVFLDDMVRASQRPEMATTYRVDALSQLVFHGMRCAAILAVELLRREQLGSSVGTGTSSSTSNNASGKDNDGEQDPVFSRGRTIRLLSVFVAQLSNVEVSEMWYHNCEQGTSLISRILDKVLDPQPQQQQQQQQQPQPQEELITEASTEIKPGNRWVGPSTSTFQRGGFITMSQGGTTAHDNEAHSSAQRSVGSVAFTHNSDMPYLTSQQQASTQSDFPGALMSTDATAQPYSNFSMPDVVPADPSSSEWTFDFPLDVPLLGNDADLMQWFEAQSVY